MSESAGKSEFSSAEARRRLVFSDQELLAECEVHTHRTGGPGGQHRNKTETAIRLVHHRLGLTVTAGETRSQHENRTKAVTRLREAIAVKFHLPPVEPVRWPENISIQAGRLRVAETNPALPQVIAVVLDSFAACDGELAKAAGQLQLTSSSLTKFLAAHPAAWVEANRIRGEHHLKPLRN